MNAYEVEAGMVCNLHVKLCDPYLGALKVRCSQNGAIEIYFTFPLMQKVQGAKLPHSVGGVTEG